VKRSWLLGSGLLALLASLTLLAFDLFEPYDESDDQFPRLIDEEQGRYGEVAFGSTEANIRAAFGEPGGGDGFVPLDADSYRGPPSIRSPDRRKPTLLRYEEVAFLVSSDGVFGITVIRPEASTLGGVRIGQPLRVVEEKYERPRCGEAVAGEPLFGSETPTYAWCQVRIASTNVFFGGDPIESITLTFAGE
jgi:hypothetical protein